MSSEMKLIMENWRKRVLKEEFAGEEKWNKGGDSDFGASKVLFYIDKKYSTEKYPDKKDYNHGMASHAIKHAHEYFDISGDLEKFKNSLINLVKTKGLYVRIKLPSKNIGTVVINSEILEIIKKSQEVFKMEKGPEKKEANKELRNDLILKTGLKDEDPTRLLDFYRGVLIPRIENPEPIDFMTTLDFHYDLNDLKSVDFFDGELINKYKKLVDNTINKNKDKFKTVQDRDPKKDKKGLELDDGTAIYLQKSKEEEDFKISTMFKPKKK